MRFFQLIRIDFEQYKVFFPVFFFAKQKKNLFVQLLQTEREFFIPQLRPHFDKIRCLSIVYIRKIKINYKCLSLRRYPYKLISFMVQVHIHFLGSILVEYEHLLAIQEYVMKTIDDFIKLGKSRGANFRLGPDHTHLADIFGVGFA